MQKNSKIKVPHSGQGSLGWAGGKLFCGLSQEIPGNRRVTLPNHCEPPHSSLARMFIGWLFILSGLCAQDVRFHNDKMSITANQASLHDVLQAIAAEGVIVRMDPGVDATVNGQLRNVPIKDGLKKLLGGFGYALRWDSLDTPHGQFKKLNRLDVFRVGHQYNLRQIRRPDRQSIKVVTTPDGAKYVADEILLGVKAGTSKADFAKLINRVQGQIAGNAKNGIYRVRLPKNTDVPSLVKQIGRDHPYAVMEPNYVIETNPPQVTDTSNSGTGQGPTIEGSPGNSAAGGNSGAAGNPTSTPTAETNTGSQDPAQMKVGPNSSLVAILDSGLHLSLDFGSISRGTYDAIQPGSRIDDPSGHGSQMALIASGSVTPNGMARADNATPFLAVKAFDNDGRATNFSMMRAVDYAVENKARVVSLSWGTETDSEFMRNTIAQAQQQGLIVVAAAGNEPNGKPQYPAAYPDVISVGALDQTGTRWKKSNYGDTLDVVAPGTASFEIGHNGPPGNYAGTSISTPLVASAMSQYLAKYPGASTEQMLKAFNDSLQDAGAPGRDPYYGNGMFTQQALELFLK